MKKNLTIDTIEAYKKVEERHTKDVENAYKLGKLDILEKIIEKIDVEEKWLIDIKMENGFISIADIEIAMSGIRSFISELKGETE